MSQNQSPYGCATPPLYLCLNGDYPRSSVVAVFFKNVNVLAPLTLCPCIRIFKKATTHLGGCFCHFGFGWVVPLRSISYILLLTSQSSLVFHIARCYVAGKATPTPHTYIPTAQPPQNKHKKNIHLVSIFFALVWVANFFIQQMKKKKKSKKKKIDFILKRICYGLHQKTMLWFNIVFLRFQTFFIGKLTVLSSFFYLCLNLIKIR